MSQRNPGMIELQESAPRAMHNPGEPHPRSRRRLAVITIAVLVAYGALWLPLELMSVFACGGDGGSPYAAGDSTVGRLCDIRERTLVGGAAWVSLVLAGPVILLAGVVAAIARRSDRSLRLSTFLAIAALAVTSLPFIALSSRCSERYREAWIAWIERGDAERGPKPVGDCDRYGGP